MRKKVVLASKSKVRKEILHSNNIQCVAIPSNVDEDVIKNTLTKAKASPEIISKNLAELKANKEPDNPWQRWIFLSNMIDAWRIFPRAFLSVYIFLLYYATMWFMALPDPTLEQSGLISVIVGAGAAWFGLYAGTAKDKINSK